MERLYSQVDPARVFVILFEDFTAHTRRTYEQVLSFLNLPPGGCTEFPAMNRRGKTRSAVVQNVLVGLGHVKRRVGLGKRWGILDRALRLNKVAVPSEPLSRERREELGAEFADDVETLRNSLESVTPPENKTSDTIHW